MLDSILTQIDSAVHSAALSESIVLPLILSACLAVFIAGLRTVLLFQDHKTWITLAIRFVAGLICFLLLVFAIVALVSIFDRRFDSDTSQSTYWIMLSIGFAVGVMLAYQAGRNFEPWLIRRNHSNVRRAGSKETRTDIREIGKTFSNPPQSTPDLGTRFAAARNNDTLYLGLDSAGKAVEVDRALWKKSHVQIMGPPGTGKGVQAGVVLTQALAYGDAVFVIDPKDDEWAPSVFQSACEQAKVPFHYISLREPVAQLNPIANAAADDVSEMFYAGFELSRSGSDADFYRLDDRKAARYTASLINPDGSSLSDLSAQARMGASRELQNGAKAFFSALTEVCELPCIQTAEGIDLAEPLRSGGCIYIVGSMRNEPQIIAQKMILVRLIQLIEQSRNRNRHCSIFLDEFKYLLSMVAINALGTIRDKGCNILLAHQSLGDFANCGAVISESAARTTVLDTTPIKWLYRASDAETATWISNQTGKTVIETQSTVANSNIELSESLSTARTISEAERNYFDLNTILSLPAGCAVCIGLGVPQLATVSPIEVEKKDMQVTEAALSENASIDLLYRIPEDAVDPVHKPSTEFVSLSEQEPRERLLRFLFEETWSHIKIIQELLKDSAPKDIERLLQELVRDNLIRSHEIETGYDGFDQVIGIRKLGIEYVQEMDDQLEVMPVFNKSSVNLVSMRHQLDMQRLRLQAESAGWKYWTKVRAKPDQKFEVVPDAVAISPSGSTVAIEVERTVKSSSRYPGIMARHLNARRLRLWDEIYYLCPNAKVADRIRGIFDGIAEVEYLGSIVRLNDEHKACFQVFSYDEDWTST